MLDRPGERVLGDLLPAVLADDAEAGVNVRAMYLATGNRGVLVTDDNAKVRELMTAMM